MRRKLIIIILYSFLNDKPTLIKSPTIPYPTYYITFKLSDDSIVHSMIRDSSGEEKFKALNISYSRETNCYILMYDITNRNEFDNIKDYYIELIKEYWKNSEKVILVGNKTDLENERKISYEEGANLAYLNNYLFIETSCAKNENVFETFEKVIGKYRKTKKINEKKKNATFKTKKKFNDTCLLA